MTVRTPTRASLLATVAALAVAAPAPGAVIDPLEGYSLLSAHRAWDSGNDSGCGIIDAYTPAFFGFSFAGNRYSSGFDGGANMLAVGGTSWEPDTNTATYTRSSNTLEVGPAEAGGLQVTRFERAHGGWLRSLIKLENTSDIGITAVPIAWDNEPDGTEIRETSDGDGEFEAGDRWVVVSGPGPAADNDRGPVGLALYGKGSPEATPGDPINDLVGENCATVQFEIDVPANSARYLLFYADMEPTVKKQKQAAENWNRKTLTDELLRGIRGGVRSKILNWDL
jgi:hypothetical protein